MHGRPSKDLKQVGEKVEANDGDTPMNKDHDEEDLGMQEEETCVWSKGSIILGPHYLKKWSGRGS